MALNHDGTSQSGAQHPGVLASAEWAGAFDKFAPKTLMDISKNYTPATPLWLLGLRERPNRIDIFPCLLVGIIQ
ncbi:MAG: hypothetical protein CL489_01390 [Acidobacteria bacterium]|nr:hypothetical protein [Acidobacteriota bacterium]